MVWHVVFDDVAKKQLAKLGKQVAKRITVFLRDRVLSSENPRSLGAALQGSELGNYWKYRVGDYRIIVNIQDNQLTVLVLRLGSRKDVYR